MYFTFRLSRNKIYFGHLRQVNFLLSYFVFYTQTHTHTHVCDVLYCSTLFYFNPALLVKTVIRIQYHCNTCTVMALLSFYRNRELENNSLLHLANIKENTC